MPQNDHHYAIAVGIDTYPQLRALTSSVKDATAFCDWLLADNGGGLPVRNVRLIPSPPNFPADSFDAKPIQHDIDRALRDFGVGQQTRIGERLYFYFAGHGLGAQYDEVGMLMASATMDLLGYNIGLRPYLDFFHETAVFDEVVVILDCCRDRDYSRDTGKPPFNNKGRVKDGKARVQDFVVAATAYGDKAFAPVEKSTKERRGILTTAVLEGLRADPGAVDARGQITASSLREYVRERVATLAKIENVAQEADILRQPQSEIVFRDIGAAPPAPKVPVRIVVPPEVAGEMVLSEFGSQGVPTEIERRDADRAREADPWQVDLALNTRYELESTQQSIRVVIDPKKVAKNVFKFPRP